MATSSRVVLFALIKNGEILLEKRKVKGFIEKQYLIPGGAINELEDLEDALKRELMEELGIIPTDFELLTNEDIPGLNNNILKPFIVNSWQGEVPKFILDKEDPYPLSWIPIKEALNMLPIKPTKRILEVLNEYLRK